MILQKLKTHTVRHPGSATSAQEVDDLRRHDWNDPLFEEWCSMATKQVVGESDPEGALHQLVSRVCV